MPLKIAICDLLLKGVMTEREMIARTKQFALRIMKLVGALPKSVQGHAIAAQLMVEGGLLKEKRIRPLLTEAGELVAITASSKKTAASALARSQVANRKSQIS